MEEQILNMQWVDGERGDIALERDRQQAQIRENKDIERFKTIERVANATCWANAGEGVSISTIVLEMIENEIFSRLLTKSEVFFDAESIHEAVNDACITLGLNDEDFAPSLHHMGHEVEIRLI